MKLPESSEKRIAIQREFIGQFFKIIIDRPVNSIHPEFPDIKYPINYGYIEGIFSPDGECIDVYVFGVDTPIKSY